MENPNPTTTGAKSVLLIDADPERRAQVRGALDGRAQIIEAADAAHGIGLALDRRPALVLVAQDLPGMDGLEVLTKLRANSALEQTPIAVIGDHAAHALALSLGADGFLEAPIQTEGLAPRLGELLEGKRESIVSGDAQRHLRHYNESLVDRLEATIGELASVNAQLTAGDQSRSEFLRNLSHELATPLTPLAGYLKILRSGKLGALTEQQIKVIDSMIGSTERLARTIDNLVDFAQLAAGVYRLQLAPIDPAALVQNVLAELRPKARAKRLHTEVVEEGPGRALVADERKLRQALTNLVDNAIKFSPQGSEILVELDRRGPGTIFAVYDQGEGMSDEQQRRAFEPFAHAVAGDARAPGAGLGLPVSRRIVEAHRGRIWLESPPKTQAASAHHFAGTKAAFEIPPLELK